MTRWRPVLVAIGLLLLGMLYVRACWEPGIRADERKRAVDAQVDSQIAIMRRSLLDTVAVYNRQRDSTGREIARLKRAVVGVTPAVPSVGPTLVSAPTTPAIALRDSLIAAYEIGRAQDSLQLLFWKAAVASRDSIIPRLQQARDSWRREASKPDHWVTDILGGAALGYGLAKESEMAAGVGGALILIPRVVDVLGRLF